MQRLLTKIQSDSNLKDLLRHSGIMYASGLFSTLLIIIQQISTAKLIGPADYGRLATVLASGTLVMLIADVRTWEIGTKLLSRPILNHEHTEVARIITWLTLADLATGFLSAVVVVILAQPIAVYLLQTPDLVWLVQLYAVSIPFRMFGNGIARTTLRMYNRFDWLSFKSVAYGLARIVFMSGAALAGLGIEGVIVGAAIAEIVGAIILLVMQWLIYRRTAPSAKMIDFQKPRQFREGIEMMKGLWLSATLSGLQIELFVPLLALLTTPTQVGLFRSGLDIAETIEKLLIPFVLVLFPQIVKSYEQHSRAQFVRLIKQASFMMAGLTLPFTLGIIVLGPLLLPRLLGEGFEDVSLVAGSIAIGFTVYGILMWTRPALIALNHIRELNIVGIVTVALSCIALPIFTPQYGAIAGGVIRGAALSIQNILLLWVFRYRLAQHVLPNEQAASS